MAPRSRARARMHSVTRLRLLVLAAAACALTATAIAIAAGDPTTGVIGPKNHGHPNRAHPSPTRKLSPLGNHPGGGALTTNGRFLWVADAGRGINDIKIIDEAPEPACKTNSSRTSAHTNTASRA